MSNLLTPFRQDRKDFLSLFDRIFDDTFNGLFGDSSMVDGSYPRIDVYEGDSELIVEATVPGLTKEQVDVLYDDDTEVLTVSTKSNKTSSRANNKYKWKEIHKSFSSRRVRLPKSQYDVGNIQAEVKDGMLTVKVPTKEVVEDNVKKIDVK